MTLKDMRRKRGMTQKELGDKMGKKQSYIAYIESGLVDGVNLSTIKDFSKALGCRAIIDGDEIIFKEK
jgi:predicted transcriptional regulator